MKKKQVVLVVMDGIGITTKDDGNAVMHAYKPHLDQLMMNYPNTLLKAHGTAVGLPTDGDMGNSEVGHNALGCGQIYAQGAKLVNESIASKEIFNTDTWNDLISYCKDNTLHFIGLLSDGNVHSHIDHLISMIKEAKAQGVKKVRIHALLDGRDVPETSALIYIEALETVLTELNDASFNAKIASGGGRMYITMDRYEANWSMVEKGWHVHVLGDGRNFSSAKQAIQTYRDELQISDQDLPEFVVVEDGKPVGTINDGDSVILFNFRGDRAIELSKAFDNDNFDVFDRIRKPKVKYAGMLQYDGDLKIPNLFLVQPPKIKNTRSEYLVKQGLSQYAISETQKFGHVTYFWNGNRTEKFDDKLETYKEILSDVLPFEQRPWMKAAEITDELIKAIHSGKYDFLRCNFPNGDMVGHTGNYQATLIGVETVDLVLARIVKACQQTDSILLITADHGNSDEMYEKRKVATDTPKPKTSHTLNKVPFIIYNADVKIKDGEFGLANVANTVIDLLDLPSVDLWEESIISK